MQAIRNCREIGSFLAARDRRDRMLTSPGSALCWRRTGALQHARTVAQAMGGAALYEFDRYFAGMRKAAIGSFMRSLLVWVLQRSH